MRKTRLLAAALGLGGFAAAAVPPAFFWYYEGPRTYRTDDEMWATFTMHGGEEAIELSRVRPGTAPSAGEVEAAASLIAGARASAVRFRNYADVVTTGGYTISIGEEHNQFHHVFNPDYMTDGRSTDPDRPESLLYFKSDTGMRLVSFMFVEPPQTHGAQVGGAMTRWHYHPVVEFCMDRQGVPRIYAENRLAGGCPDGMINGPTPEMMHVWLVDNPYGVFSHEMALRGEAHAGGHRRYNPWAEFARRSYLWAADKVSGRNPWVRSEDARALEPLIPHDSAAGKPAGSGGDHRH